MECFKLKTTNCKAIQKWWWDASLRQAKPLSLSLFNAWKNDNFREGSPCHAEYISAKNSFKNLVRFKKKEAAGSFNNNLLESLKHCQPHKFWKLWNANAPGKANSRNSKFKFQNLNDDLEIANHLAASHEANCCPKNNDLNNRLKEKFFANKAAQNEHSYFSHAMLTIDHVDKAIQKIENNSTSGYDNIHIEHFKLAHPSVIFILKSIFNIFISIGEVPSDFGLGLVTPIPKFQGHKINVSAEDFRSITINVIPSKKFEHSIASFFDQLITPDRQFGFKRGFSCTLALSQVRNTIQYFNRRGSTINLGFIDVKKAFDSANFWGILLLLQKHHIHPITPYGKLWNLHYCNVVTQLVSLID